jgi:hypothetical protein
MRPFEDAPNVRKPIPATAQKIAMATAKLDVTTNVNIA